MSKIINYVLSFTAVGKFLDEKKTLIGAIFTVAAGVLEILEKVAPLYPETAFLASAESGLKEAISVTASTLESLGFGFLTVGLVHKGAKARLAKEEK